MSESRVLIEGMTCAHCERAVSEALSPLAGVTEVHVSAADGIATLHHDADLDAGAVAAAVADAGYSVRE